MNCFWSRQYQYFLQQVPEEYDELKSLLPEEICHAFRQSYQQEQQKWQQALALFDDVEAKHVDLDRDCLYSECSLPLLAQGFDEVARVFIPWRKGPFQINQLKIDTEWRSDWKWQRIEQAIAPLEGKNVLDVGCGSGYHCFRMKAAGADKVFGIEPMLLYVAQFWWLNRFFQQQDIAVFPFTLEQWLDFPVRFDQVFSMGVLYHRRSPIDHLVQLRQCLRSGGQLVLETLIIAGENNEILLPQDRYAKMRNVWFIPTVKHLENWLQRTGFQDIQLIDVNQTSTEEQRSTEWMPFESLKDFLDPHDRNKTIEGYPAPLRATFSAIKK